MPRALRRFWPFSWRPARIERKIDWSELKLDLLLERSAKMALNLDKLNAGVAAIEAKVGDLKTQNAALQAQVADLQGQIAAGPADQAAVDAVGDKLAADAA